jgi:hypothetical protein
MGEATYYLKAYFNSNDDAKRAMVQITPLIEQGIEAQDWWQDHRGMDESERPEFWKQFSERFPAVTEYLGETRSRNSLVGGDCNNELAGELDFGSDSDIESLMLNGSEIWYCGYVWHFADWTRLADAFYRAGAVKVNWISDENMNPFDTI